jgi:general secretion pathway protein K
VKGREGFVLIAVIFITGLLAVTTTAFVANVKSNTLFARALLYNQQLESAADGMARLTAFQFATRDVEKPFPMTFVCRWNENINIQYDIQDQAGLVDLNTANPALFIAVLQGLGKPATEASAIAAAIADYKDPDAQAQDGGDEAALYKGPSTGPSDGPFMTVEELDRIPLIDNDLYTQIMPLVTVHSQQPGFDPSQAPKALLDAVGANKAGLFASPSPVRVYAIRVTAKRERGGAFTRATIIALTGQPDRPYALLKWNVSRLVHSDKLFPPLTTNCASAFNLN